MKVKDIIKASAMMLSKDNVVGYLTNENTNNDANTLREVNVFTTLLNCLLNELAGTYIPMKKTEKIDGKLEVEFKDLSENVVKIVEVLGENEERVIYEQKTQKLIAYAPCYYVTYEYVPSYYSLSDTIGYTHKDVSKTALSYGLCSEYLISEARYKEAMVFHEKYVEAIKNIQKTKNKKTVARKWA